MAGRTHVAALAAAALLAAPAAAQAATATVTGDDGNPVALAPAATIRTMSPTVAVSFAPTEKRYALSITGPSGAPASYGETCIGTSFFSPERVNYQGNGTYTVTVRTSEDDQDTDCAKLGPPQTFTFTIAAHTAVAAPAARVLLRKPGEFAGLTYAFHVDLNPGADTHELRYAAGAALGGDGAISGPSETGYVGPDGTANVTFEHPGVYTFVVRATRFAGSGDASTPWSAPVQVTVLAPFDLVTTSFPDSRGPVYRLRGQVREPTAAGSVVVSVARGRKGGRFRRIGSPRIASGGVFSLRFKLKRTGTYRLRYAYKGSATVAAGTVTEVIKIRRRLFF